MNRVKTVFLMTALAGILMAIGALSADAAANRGRCAQPAACRISLPTKRQGHADRN